MENNKSLIEKIVLPIAIALSAFILGFLQMCSTEKLADANRELKTIEIFKDNILNDNAQFGSSIKLIYEIEPGLAKRLENVLNERIVFLINKNMQILYADKHVDRLIGINSLVSLLEDYKDKVIDRILYDIDNNPLSVNLSILDIIIRSNKKIKLNKDQIKRFERFSILADKNEKLKNYFIRAKKNILVDK